MMQPSSPSNLSGSNQRQDPPARGSLQDTMKDEESTPYYAMETSVPPVMPKNEDMGDDENLSLSGSIVSSVMTADGIHDTTGFTLVCFIILIGDMSRGIFFPTLWPLVASLNGSTVHLGYCVAAFSFGRVLVSPVFGQWSITYGYSKTLLFASSMLFIGSLFYAQVQNVGRIEFLYLAQTLLGIGSGTLGVTRAFVAEVTAQRNRTTYMAWITAVQYGGFTVTPFLGALFSKLLGNSEYNFGLIRLNMFTAPAYFLSMVIAISLCALSTLFKDRQRMQKAKKKSSKRAQIDDYANQTTVIGLTIYDCCILGCMLLNVATKGSISSFETLGINIAMEKFDLLPSQAATIVATCGSIGVVALLSMGHLSKMFTDLQLIGGGMLVMATGIASLEFIDEDQTNASWRWWLAIFLIYSIGYPIGHTAVIGLFSKIVGRRPQGVLMGWFASAGSVARITFPIMSGYVSNLSGNPTLFYILMTILLLSTFFTIAARNPLSMLSR